MISFARRKFKRPLRCSDYGWESKQNSFISKSVHFDASKCDTQSRYTSSYKKYTDSSRSSVSCQKYADSYITATNNRTDEIDSHFNLDNSFDCVSSRATVQTKTSNDLDNRRIDTANSLLATREPTNKAHTQSIESNDKELNVSDECTLTNDSRSELEIDLTLLKFEEFRIEFGGLPTVNFEEKFVHGQSFRIFLSQIHSPYKFWFHLKEEEENIANLMSSLEYD